MHSLYHTVVTKRELSQKAKLFVYRAIFVPTLNYGHEVWVMTERTRLRIQADEMSFLGPVARTSGYHLSEIGGDVLSSARGSE